MAWNRLSGAQVKGVGGVMEVIVLLTIMAMGRMLKGNGDFDDKALKKSSEMLCPWEHWNGGFALVGLMTKDVAC